MHLDGNAEAAYLGYAASTGGKTFDGRDMPGWQELPQRIRDAWAAAVQAAFAAELASHPSDPSVKSSAQAILDLAEARVRDERVTDSNVLHDLAQIAGAAKVILAVEAV